MTLRSVELAEPWIRPLSGSDEAGEDARYAAEHIAVRDEVAKLDDLSGAEVSWQVVSQNAAQVLRSRSKDLLIAGHWAVAQVELRGAEALPEAIALPAAMMATYANRLFPQRNRARANALRWWTDRLAERVMNLELGAGVRRTLELAIELEKELSNAARDCLGDDAPSFRDLRESLERQILAAPAATSTAEASTAGAGEDGAAVPTPASTVAAVAPAPEALASQPESGEGAPSRPVAEPDSEAQVASVPAAEQADPRMEAWLRPISESAPAGLDTTYDEAGELIRREIAKLDSPAAGQETDWELVRTTGATLLTKQTKDLLVGAHLAAALWQLEGLSGLKTGLDLLSGLCERYWETVYPPPKRMRRRANALAWLLLRMETLLPGTPVAAGDDAALDALLGSMERLSSTAAERFEGEGPACRPALDELRKLRLSVPAPKPPPAPGPAPAEAPSKPREESAPSPSIHSTSSQSGPPSPPPPDIALDEARVEGALDPAQIPGYLRKLGTSLQDIAAAVRSADNANPKAYRLLRVGAWLGLEAIELRTGGKTSFVGPPDTVRQEIESALAESRWESVLELSEAAVRKFPLWVGGSRFSHRALSQMGKSHAAAANAVKSATCELLVRLPALLEARFRDGSLAVTEEDSEVFAVASGAGAAGGTGAGTAAPRLTPHVRGKPQAEALAKAEALISQATSPRDRFALRLEFAEFCVESKQLPIALGLYEGLADVVKRHALDEWDAELAVRVHGGLLRAISLAHPKDRANHPLWHGACASLAYLKPSELTNAVR